MLIAFVSVMLDDMELIEDSKVNSTADNTSLVQARSVLSLEIISKYSSPNLVSFTEREVVP